MVTAKYSDRDYGEWEKQDFQAKIYEILLASYEQPLEEMIEGGEYGGDTNLRSLERELEDGYQEDDFLEGFLEEKDEEEEKYD